MAQYNSSNGSLVSSNRSLHETMIMVTANGSPITTSNPMVVTGPTQVTYSTTIANGASLSTAVTLGNYRPVGIVTPASWTTANITFQVSYDGVTYADLYDETGVEVSYVLVAGKSMRLPIADWLGVANLKIRSGTSATPVNQGADRAFTVVAQ